MQWSAEWSAMYQNRNKVTEKNIQRMFGFGYELNIAIHIIPALFPLLYYIFGSPSPPLWLTPYGLYDA